MNANVNAVAGAVFGVMRPSARKEILERAFAFFTSAPGIEFAALVGQALAEKANERDARADRYDERVLSELFVNEMVHGLDANTVLEDADAIVKAARTLTSKFLASFDHCCPPAGVARPVGGPSVGEPPPGYIAITPQRIREGIAEKLYLHEGGTQWESAAESLKDAYRALAELHDKFYGDVLKDFFDAAVAPAPAAAPEAAAAS